MRELRGKKALVTGAASGIGRCIALALAREGVDLYLLDINSGQLEKVVKELRYHKVEANFVACDLSQTKQISHTVETILNHWGKLDILVNNAGVAYYGPTERMTPDQWDWLLRVNLHAPIQLIWEFLPHMLNLPEAHIVNVSSIAGLIANRKLAAYHASKFALVGLTESLRAEYSYRGLGLTSLCPGPVKTNFFDSMVMGNKSRKKKKPPRLFSVSPELVAKKTIQAIKRNKRLVLVSLLAHLLWILKRFAPGVLEFTNQVRRRKESKTHPLQTFPSIPVDENPDEIDALAS